MANYTVTDSDLTSIANAIRTKGGTQASLEYPSEFISAINAIPTGSSIEVDSLSVSQNGTYTAQSGHAYSPVTVSVPQTQIDSLSVTQNGTYTAQSGHAYSPVVVNIPPPPAELVWRQVNFIDYDGTLLYSYTKEEANALTELPENPSHEGLTAQGWNWTLAQINAQLTALPEGDIYVGQMYITQSGNTEIDISIPTDSMFLALCITVNGFVYIDWGDNSTRSQVNDSSLNTRHSPSHTYQTAGDYTISIIVDRGEFTFYESSSTSSSYLILRYSGDQYLNRSRTNCVKKVRLGSGITQLKDYSFYYCTSLESITIPSSVTYLGQYTFGYCYSLKSATIPANVTNLGSYTFGYCNSLIYASIPTGTNSFGGLFYNCFSLRGATIPASATSINSSSFASCRCLRKIALPNTFYTLQSYTFNYCSALEKVIIPDSVHIIGQYAFSECDSLKEVVIPNSVESIGYSSFSNCDSLAKITMPDDITTIDAYAFSNNPSLTEIDIPSGLTKINNYAFNQCYALSKVTIPDSVTQIGNNVFTGCYFVSEYHFLPTEPPTITANSINVVNDTIIYVPYSADHSVLNAYKAAANFSTYASHIQEEPQ